MYETQMKNRQALITRYLSNHGKWEDTTPAVVAEKDDDDDDDDLLVYNKVAPKDLGNGFEGFALADHAPEWGYEMLIQSALIFTD